MSRWNLEVETPRGPGVKAECQEPVYIAQRRSESESGVRVSGRHGRTGDWKYREQDKKMCVEKSSFGGMCLIQPHDCLFGVMNDAGAEPVIECSSRTEEAALARPVDPLCSMFDVGWSMFFDVTRRCDCLDSTRHCTCTTLFSQRFYSVHKSNPHQLLPSTFHHFHHIGSPGLGQHSRRHHNNTCSASAEGQTLIISSQNIKYSSRSRPSSSFPSTKASPFPAIHPSIHASHIPQRPTTEFRLFTTHRPSLNTGIQLLIHCHCYPSNLQAPSKRPQ